MLRAAGLIVLIVIAVFGLIIAVRTVPAQDGLVTTNYILAIVASAGTLAGLGFAIYGWFQSRLLPSLVERAVAQQSEAWARQQRKDAYRQQQAMQKVIASYTVQNAEQRIELLRRAIEIDTDVYNGYVALGYAYIDKGELSTAEHMFETEYERHGSYEAACDIAWLYLLRKEPQAALRWLQKAVKIDDYARKGIAIDSRFEPLRREFPAEYKSLVGD